MALLALLGSLTPIDAPKEVPLGDGEHLAANEALPVAQVEYLGKELGDVVAQMGDESSYRCEVRGAVTTQGDEGDVVGAGAFYSPAADDALAVPEGHFIGVQDDFEQHSRRVGRRTVQIVAVAGVEAGQVQLVVDQVVERVFKGAGQQLPFKIDGNEAWAGVDVFVAGHGDDNLIFLTG